MADAFNEYFVEIGRKLAAKMGDLTSQTTKGSDNDTCSNSYFGPRCFVKLAKLMLPQV